MSDPSPQDLKRLGEAVYYRRHNELRMTQEEVHRNGGPSTTTQTKIEAGRPPAPSVRALRNLEAALEWPDGQTWAILRGEVGPGDVIASTRKERGLSHSDLAELLEVGPKAVAEWEQGETIPPRVLERLRLILAAAPAAELIAEVGRRVGEAG